MAFVSEKCALNIEPKRSVYVILDSDWKFSTSGVWIDGYGIVPTEYDAV